MYGGRLPLRIYPYTFPIPALHEGYASLLHIAWRNLKVFSIYIRLL